MDFFKNARDNMWRLISTKDQSKMEMLKLFYETNEPITIDRLSKETKSSPRSVKNYLKELRGTIEEIGGEFQSSSEGVNFKIPTNIGIDYFQKQLFKQSLGFILLEKIFFNETLTNEQLINELFISQSTLNRSVNSLNSALESYGLKLKTSPYKVIGEEYLIRNFYTSYFVEAYTANEWPFENLDKEFVEKLLPSASDYYQSTSDVMSYPHFRFRFAVDLVRNLKGYSVELPLSENDSMSALYDKLTTEIEHEIEDLTFDHPLEKKSYVNALAVCQLNISKKLLNQQLLQDETLKKQLNEVKQMIDFLTEHFELKAENQTNLIVEMNKALLFFSRSKEQLQPKEFILFTPRDYFLVSHYQKKYTTFYDMVLQNITLLCKNRGFQPTEDTLNYLIYLLISKWSGLTKQLFNRYHSIVVKVYSPLSFRHAQNIVESLISDLPRSLEVSVLEEPIVNEEVLSTIDFDILVTTQTLFLNIEQPIIFMYRTRSSHQYDELQYLIRKIAEQKEKNAREKFMNKKIPHLQDKKSKFNVIT